MCFNYLYPLFKKCLILINIHTNVCRNTHKYSCKEPVITNYNQNKNGCADFSKLLNIKPLVMKHADRWQKREEGGGEIERAIFLS